MGWLEKAFELGIKGTQRVRAIQARPRIIYLHAQAYIHGAPPHPIRYLGSEQIFYPNRAFPSFADWEEYQAALPEMIKLRKDFEEEIRKNYAKFLAALILLIGAAIKKFVETVAEYAEVYDELIKDNKALEAEIEKALGESKGENEGAEDNLKTKKEALDTLKQQRATFMEWLTGAKAAEEQRLEKELKEGMEAVEKMKKTLAFNRRILEQAEERMRNCNDPTFSL